MPEAVIVDAVRTPIGHPFGMTGARIMTTLLSVMETDDHEVGLETMCVAGGQGEAMIVERLS
jgi:acetyl-CoA C-acetyltransferase